MRLEFRLPSLDCHIPADGKLPNGLGLPVRANYDGPRIGSVIGWDDKGDGTAIATVDVELPFDLDPESMAFGLDGNAAIDYSKDPPVITEILVLTGVGVWPKGLRPMDREPHIVEGED